MTHFDSYASLVEHVEASGAAVDSRLGPMREYFGAGLYLPTGVIPNRKNLNLNLGWAEALQLLAGVFDPAALKRVAPKADHSLFTLHMAYGPRTVDQWPLVIEELKENPESRRAVIFIAKPDDTSNTIPCTLNIGFLIRNGQLQTNVYMRSWDVHHGLPYDIMMFSMAAQAVAACLQIPAGVIKVTATSMHLYDQHKGFKVLPSVGYKVSAFDNPRYTPDWPMIQRWAQRNLATLDQGIQPGWVVYTKEGAG